MPYARFAYARPPYADESFDRPPFRAAMIRLIGYGRARVRESAGGRYTFLFWLGSAVTVYADFVRH